MKSGPTCILLLCLCFCAFFNDLGWSAETIDQRFDNVDQVVGWIKAKGKCGKAGEFPMCTVKISLPSKDSTGKLFSPGWTIEGWLQSIYLKDYGTHVIAVINRTRRTRLSDKDPNAVINIQKETKYDFNPQGQLAESTVALTMKNFRGEELLNLALPVPRRTLLVSVENTEDFGFLLTGFRFG